MHTTSGLHHVTAITADAQKNLDFYCGVLGLRLVKLTVNFDDPASYHLYYGDEQGRPGTILTFFAWPGAQQGRIGPPQVTSTAFAVAEGALAFWERRLAELGVVMEQVTVRMGERVLRVNDPDGLSVELAETKGIDGNSPAIARFHSVTISEEGYESTANLLTRLMGFKQIENEGNRFRYRAGSNDFASLVDLICVPDARRSSLGSGVVHHVAFRTPNDAQQQSWRAALVESGYNVSPVMDRNYFHSIYFREPGGVLFEIATEPPGFAVDEASQALGTSLRLPVQYEPLRSRLEQILPKLRLPEWRGQVHR